MKQKTIEWLKRYLPAGIISTIIMLVASELTFKLTKSHLYTALVATWVSSLGYFSCMLIFDILKTKSELALKGDKYSGKTLLLNLRALVVEFGIAEIFDSFLIRPTLMYYIPIWLNDLTLGILIAKFAADITFYIPAIISYELSKKRFRKFD